MAVTQVKLGEWKSSLTGLTYSSREAAIHYEDIQRAESRTATKGEKILAGLSPEEFKSVCLSLSASQDAEANMAAGMEQGAEYFIAHPEIICAGEAGTRNGASINTWLKQQGRNFPYDSHDYDNAVSALMELGVLQIDPSLKRKEKPADQNENWNPLDAWKLHQRYY